MSHYNDKTIIIGSTGFLGKNYINLLKKNNIEYCALNSKNFNLINTIDKETSKNLNEAKNSTIIFFSALTPDKGKDIKTYNLNIKIAENFLNIYENENQNHVIYISSDAVYPLSIENITIDTLPSPTDLYSSMHLTREIMFKEKYSDNLTIIRPTLIFGYGDTHNSYGPNRFFNQLMSDKEITIFGDGLDIRDHLYINDFCYLLNKVVKDKMYGIFNFASGNSISYYELANLFKNLFPEISIKKIPVNNKKTQRFFNVKKFLNEINFKFSNLEDSIIEYSKLLNIR